MCVLSCTVLYCTVLYCTVYSIGIRASPSNLVHKGGRGKEGKGRNQSRPIVRSKCDGFHDRAKCIHRGLGDRPRGPVIGHKQRARRARSRSGHERGRLWILYHHHHHHYDCHIHSLTHSLTISLTHDMCPTSITLTTLTTLTTTNHSYHSYHHHHPSQP